MSYGPAINTYRNHAVQTASPLQLIVMLYDGALRFIEAGRDAMARRDLFEQNQQLQKAQNIVSELTASLDLQKGGEVAANLFSLFTFVSGRLVSANIEDDPHYLDEAVKVLAPLRESWAELEKQQRSQATPTEGLRLAS